jgi:hypothetical protein
MHPMYFKECWVLRVQDRGSFLGPIDLDVTNAGTVVFKEYVYVAEVQNNRISVFTWKPDIQPTTNNPNLKGSLENNSTAVTSK